MLKIFMTGDNHIGLKYADHEAGETLAKKRIEAFEKMVEKANAEKCDIFAITGDLFEGTEGIDKKDIADIIGCLSGFSGRVLVLPGNHDYYDREASVWKDFVAAMDSCSNILLLNKYKPYSFSAGDNEVVVYPAFCTSEHSESGENNLGWIKEENIVPDGKYRIGIAHGTIEGETIDNEKTYFFMSKEELENIPVDAWLIGHTHVPYPYNLTEEYSDCGRIFNAGCHVQRDVHNDTEGLCFILEIDENKRVWAKKFVSGNLRFCRREIKLSAGKTEEILERELSALDDESVLDGMRFSGAVSFEEYDARYDIIEKYTSRFIENHNPDYSGISRLISRDFIESNFPENCISAVFLTELIEEPTEAQLAYELLEELKKGGKTK